MSICVISQPRFFPGFHYIHRMMVADIFVIFDTVQFTPRHEENRTKLKAQNGPQWLTAPMRKVHRGQLITETFVNDEMKDKANGSQPWSQKAIKTLDTLYGGAPYYKRYAPEIHQILEAEHKTITALDVASWEPALRGLDISCKFIYASDLPVKGKGPQLLLNICKYLGTDTYLSGSFGKEYLDNKPFVEEGITIKFHEYTYPVYKQRFGEFVPYLSYLDMLFNVGWERELVLHGGKMTDW